jgi:hypothetical protein
MVIKPNGSLTEFALGVVGLSVFALLIFVVTCVLTAIPGVLVVWLSEIFRMRSVLFFSCAGAAIGALSQTLLFRAFTPVSWLFVVAGCVAGLGYWYVAGKHAGRDRRFA